MTGIAGLPSLGSLHGVRVVEAADAYEKVEDWSQVRSPARARRRRAKYPQRIKLVYRPTMFQVGGTIYAHPEIYARLKAEIPTTPCPRSPYFTEPVSHEI